ncbi:MAG: hypothetical protein WCX74_01725 [Candidatus Paceibacterota bacterium]
MIDIAIDKKITIDIINTNPIKPLEVTILIEDCDNHKIKRIIA